MAFNKNMKTVRRQSDEIVEVENIGRCITSEKISKPSNPERAKSNEKEVKFSPNIENHEPNREITNRPAKKCFKKSYISKQILLKGKLRRTLPSDYPFAQRNTINYLDVKPIVNNNLEDGYALVYVDPDTCECYAMCTEKFQRETSQYYISAIFYYMSKGKLLSECKELNPDGTLPEGYQLAIS